MLEIQLQYLEASLVIVLEEVDGAGEKQLLMTGNKASDIKGFIGKSATRSLGLWESFLPRFSVSTERTWSLWRRMQHYGTAQSATSGYKMQRRGTVSEDIQKIRQGICS